MARIAEPFEALTLDVEETHGAGKSLRHSAIGGILCVDMVPDGARSGPHLDYVFPRALA
jgi:hypothetical protein